MIPSPTDCVFQHATPAVAPPLNAMYVSRQIKVPNTSKEVRFKIIRNIGAAFVRMGQFQVGFSTFPIALVSLSMSCGDQTKYQAVLRPSNWLSTKITPPVGMRLLTKPMLATGRNWPVRHHHAGKPRPSDWLELASVLLRPRRWALNEEGVSKACSYSSSGDCILSRLPTRSTKMFVFCRVV